MDEKALTTTKPESSALDVYGSGDDIKRLARRIKLGLPGGEKLTNDEALTLAQIGLAHGLDVMTGEAWYIPGKGPMVGIRGLRKAARNQSNYWPDLELLTAADKAALNIPEKAIAYRCRIFRTDMILQSAAAIKAMREAGMANAAERYAYKPAEGTGYWTPGENTKMKGDQAARKRAEAEALKVAFDLPFGSESGNGNRVGYVDAEWREVADPEPSKEPPGISYILSGDPDAPGLGDEPEPPASSTGPTWTAELAPEDGDDGQPVVEPAKPAQKLADVEPAVRDEWREAARVLAAAFPAIYLTDDGAPNYYRMRGALVKHGIQTVRADNLEEAVDVLRSHANQKLAEALTEPLPQM